MSRFRPDLSVRLKDIAEKQVPTKLKPMVGRFLHIFPDIFPARPGDLVSSQGHPKYRGSKSQTRNFGFAMGVIHVSRLFLRSKRIKRHKHAF